MNFEAAGLLQSRRRVVIAASITYDVRTVLFGSTYGEGKSCFITLGKNEDSSQRALSLQLTVWHSLGFEITPEM
jgi:hypothetical protein